MRKLNYGMNVTLDGYIAAPGDDIGWSGPPSDELFQWWLDQERASGLSLYGRKLWEVRRTVRTPCRCARRWRLRFPLPRAVAGCGSIQQPESRCARWEKRTTACSVCLLY